MNRVRKQIGCETAYRSGITGKKIGIGVLDSGVAFHPDLKDCIYEFRDFVYEKSEMYDDSGHGTFVCGVLSGSGYLSEGTYRGIAPDARLYVGKVLKKDGDGDYDKLAAGLEWLLENKELFGLKLINISAGSKHKGKGEQINSRLKRVNDLIKQAYESDVLVVTAAGNFGPETGSVSMIGATGHAICVGCHDGNYKLENTVMCEQYSGRGPSDFVLKKPDIVAPGTAIVSCGLNGYCTKSGTSMATPIVTGALALAYEKFAGKSAKEMQHKLFYSANDLLEPWNKQGWGMVNVEKLLRY